MFRFQKLVVFYHIDPSWFIILLTLVTLYPVSHSPNLFIHHGEHNMMDPLFMMT